MGFYLNKVYNKVFKMMSKLLLAVLVISLAYVSDAVSFRERFPDQKFGDLAECKDKTSIEGHRYIIPNKNRYGTKDAVACAKYCLKHKLRGEREGDDELKAIVGSVWIATNKFTIYFLRRYCSCRSGGTPVFEDPAFKIQTSCIFKTETETETETEKPKPSPTRHIGWCVDSNGANE